MSHCWKCGRELPPGKTECDYGCAPDLPTAEESAEYFIRNFAEVDWTKVTTLADLIAILSVHGDPIWIHRDSPDFEKLKKYLKPIEPHEN